MLVHKRVGYHQLPFMVQKQERSTISTKKIVNYSTKLQIKMQFESQLETTHNYSLVIFRQGLSSTGS